MAPAVSGRGDPGSGSNPWNVVLKKTREGLGEPEFRTDVRFSAHDPLPGKSQQLRFRPSRVLCPLPYRVLGLTLRDTGGTSAPEAAAAKTQGSYRGRAAGQWQ